MINPISSAAHGVSGAGGLNEAVVRFGAMQESREQQRSERATEESDASPVDQAFLEALDDLPDEGQAPAQQSGGGAAPAQSHRTSSRDENSISGRGPGQDGLQEQQDQAIAQHAAEQHGKREVVKNDVDRSQRSTREMMGRIESKGGVEESHAPKSESQGPSSAHKSSGGGASHGASGASGHKGAAPSGGGGHAPAASMGGPRVGGDVLAAAVGSGAATTEEIAPGSAQASDTDDDHGQQEDSSQESIKARGEDQGKRVSRERSLDGQAGFHDGDGGREDSRKKFGQESPGGRQEGSRQQQTAGGEGSDEQPHREPASDAPIPAAETTAPEPPPLFPDDRDRVESTAPANAPADPPPAASQPPAEATAGTARADRGATPATEHGGAPPQPPQAPLAEAQPPSIDRLPVADAFERTAPAFSMGSDSLLGDEYFFFDDARTTPDAPAPQ